MHRVREQIGCEQLSWDGSRITIAVLDTGIADHPDFKDRILDFYDFIYDREMPYDDSGHGTHVCGIAGGSGLLSAGRYKGIAPGAGLVVGKVLDRNGDGAVDAMVSAIDWVMEIKEENNIRILNVSVGVGQLINGEKADKLKNKLEEAWKRGLLVVCAAGNSGPACDSLSTIGKSPMLITVGCHDGEYFKEKENRCSSYSARGPMAGKIRKPDIVAPGTEIISCNGKYIKKRGNFYNAYISKSGTSMATPVISGALALLLQKHPEYDNETAKRKLLYSAKDLKEPWYQQGWGMVNVAGLLM